MKNVIAVLCMLALVVSLSACASYDTKGMVVMTAPCTVEVVVIEQAKVVRITDSVMFDWDSDKIRDDQKPILDDIAAMMVEYPDTLIVLKGFASEEGATDYNMALSSRRAESVRSGLQERGVAPSKIQGVAGFGETVEFGDLLKLNRRVLVITVN